MGLARRLSIAFAFVMIAVVTPMNTPIQSVAVAATSEHRSLLRPAVGGLTMSPAMTHFATVALPIVLIVTVHTLTPALRGEEVAASRGMIAPQTKAEKAKFVEISGKTNPELIPQYLVWESAFRTFAQRASIEGFDLSIGHSLTMTPKERDRLELYAKADVARDAQCVTALERLREQGRIERTTASELERRGQAIILEYRYQTLAAVDALYAELGPDARASLDAWIARHKTAISVTVPQDQLRFFRLPR